MTESGALSGRRAAWIGLAVLTFINLFNYLDRYVLAALVESLRDPTEGLGLNDAQAGSLMTGFIIVYMLASPIFGTLGDRYNRGRLIALGVALWSVATAAGGLAGTFLFLFVARASVGIGEAAYGTIAPAMLADYFPLRLRGRVFSIFFCAIPVGSALGYVIGGLMNELFGWRNAFLVAGLPGLALAAAVLLIRDPPRGAQDEDATETAARDKPDLRTYLELFRNIPYLLTVLGYAAYTFALGGLAFWMPSFLVRARGLSQQDATVLFGAIIAATGLVGTFVGGWAADWLLKRTKQAYLWVSGVATLLAAPCVVLAIVAGDRVLWMGGIVAGVVLLFVSTGPINAAIVNVVTPERRATAVALSIFMIHVLGDVPSPSLIGLISDSSSLAQAFLIVPGAVVLGGLIWCWEAWRASHVEPSA